MQPAKKGITIIQGETFRLAFRLYSRDPATEVVTFTDLTGYTGRCVVREFPNSTTPLATFTVTIHADQVGNRGRVDIYGSTTATADVDRDGIWAVSLTSPGGDVDTWIEGPVQHQVSVARA